MKFIAPIWRLLLAGILLQNSVMPAAAQESMPGEVQRVDTGERDSTTIVRITGPRLKEVVPIKSVEAGAPTLFVTINNAVLSQDVLQKRPGSGAIKSIELRQVAKQPYPYVEMRILLVADLRYEVKVQNNGIAITIFKDSKKVAALKTPISTPSAYASTTLVPAGVEDVRAPSNYEIRSGDALFIAVSPAEELSRELVVDEEGRLSIPLLGAVEASGKTPEALARVLTKRMAQFVSNPKVEVFLRQATGKQVTIMGQVRSPGLYPHHARMRVMDLVTAAGGFTPASNKKDIKVYRGTGADRRATIVDLDSILKSGDISKDFLLEAGDIVEIPRGSNSIILFGDVAGGGVFEHSPNMRMLDLVSTAGGFRDGADFNHIRIFRGAPPDQKVIKVPFARVLKGDMRSNIILQPGDVIFVPRRSIWTYSAFANALSPVTAMILTAATVLLAVKK